MKYLPLIPIHESEDFQGFHREVNEKTWYFICSKEDLQNIEETPCLAEDLMVSEDIEFLSSLRDEHFPNHHIVSLRGISPGGLCGFNNLPWQESIRYIGLALFNGTLKEIRTIEETQPLINEGKRAVAASNARLKRIVQDTLNRSKTFKDAVKDVKISNNKLTINLDKKVYLFEIDRNDDGWITKVKFLAPKGRSKEIQGLRRSIINAFKSSSFQQIIEDAASTDPPKLIMLDYTRLDGGRRTRLSEPYSYRYNPNKHRWYYYGWNVEEGGIRSYILERIKGARLTDIDFKPRFFIEVGRGRKTGDRSMNKMGELPIVVKKPVIKRAHTKFDLKGGYGKIIKRLGHSVPTPMKQTQDKKEKREKKNFDQRVSRIKKRAQSTATRRRSLR